MPFQTAYTRYSPRGYIGDLARPEEPHAFDIGPCYVASSGRSPRPGDSIYWNTTQNAFEVPNSEATREMVIGVVSYDPGTVPKTDSSGDPYVEYDNGDIIKVLVMGTVWLEAGSAIERFSPIHQHVASSPDYQWDTATLSGTQSVTTLARRLLGTAIVNVDPDPVTANSIFMARIAYGRITNA